MGYSYSTSGGGIKQSKPKNVVYGSGIAPTPKNKPRPVPVGQRPVSVTGSLSGNSFQPPSKIWDGFNPSRKPYVPQSPYHKTQKPNVNFQQPVQISSSSFINQNSAFQAAPVSNSISPNRLTVQPFPQFPSLPTNQQFLRPQNSQQQPNVAVNSPHLYKQPLVVNSPIQFQQNSPHAFNKQGINRQQSSHFQVHQQQHVPTPQQAFGEAGSSIHPGLIPTSADNFVIEKATFQVIFLLILPNLLYEFIFFVCFKLILNLCFSGTSRSTCFYCTSTQASFPSSKCSQSCPTTILWSASSFSICASQFLL